MARVLVTGGSGFVGTHVVQALTEAGHEVTCLVRKTSRTEQIERYGVKLVYGDVCDEQSTATATQGVEVIYHLAGVTKTLSARRFQKVNEGGVKNVAQAAAQTANPPVLVLVSSLAAAGPSTFEQPRDECDPSEPISQYGRSKRGGELVAQRWANEVPISIVRPPVVVGQGDSDGLGLFRPIARWGVHCVPGFRAWRLSLIHAADLARALMLVARCGQRIASQDSPDSSPAQGYYFVDGSGHPTFAQLGQLIGEALGRRSVRVWKVPRGVVWCAAGATELSARLIRKPLIFNLDKAREATAGSWTCSDQVIRRTLGYSPAKPLAERLAETVAWYREQGWL